MALQWPPLLGPVLALPALSPHSHPANVSLGCPPPLPVPKLLLNPHTQSCPCSSAQAGSMLPPQTSPAHVTSSTQWDLQVQGGPIQPEEMRPAPPYLVRQAILSGCPVTIPLRPFTVTVRAVPCRTGIFGERTIRS